MTPEQFQLLAIDPALDLLPTKMDSRQARAMLLAIALQESSLEHRHQVGGPARGYFQFEQGGGVKGVLTHPASKSHIQAVLAALDYDQESDATICYQAIQHNDILAAAFARLLLWTLPDPLPERGEVAEAWDQYLDAWRPGKPHLATWEENFVQAWDVVMAA